MARRRKNSGGNSNGATLGFERQLWKAANTLRGNMDAAEYKHVVLGLIFLKHISDAFEQHRAKLLREPYADPEDPDEYLAANIFWVPKEARRSYLQHGYVLTPGRYVGIPPQEDDGEPFEEKMARLVNELRRQQEEARRLDEMIWRNLEAIGYGHQKTS